MELLRRGCTEIWCFDASGDSLTTFDTIGEAIELARSELGVEIDLDPSPLSGDGDHRHAEQVFAIGHYRFDDDRQTPGDSCS